MIMTIMREKIQRSWIAPLRVQAGSIRRSAEQLYHAEMVGQGGEGRDTKHRMLMRGCMDVLNSNGLQWASCCGVSFGGCNAHARSSTPSPSSSHLPTPHTHDTSFLCNRP